MAVHLVRHAHAGERSATDDDELRPLSKRGRAQVEAIVDHLADRPIGRVLSSRYLRCVQTVAPLGDRLGLAVATVPALAEEADGTDAWALLEKLAAEPDDSVVCSHGNIVGPLLDRLHRRGVELVAEEWSCRKGSVWRVEIGPDGSFARAVLAVVGGRS
jgi:8-oxo-dGTP diphosphatase